jgi:putative transposase
MITDGTANFHDAFNEEFWTRENPRTRHIQHIRLQGDHNNNKMERMNGQVRDREKVMRGLKRTDTAVLTDKKQRRVLSKAIKRQYCHR